MPSFYLFSCQYCYGFSAPKDSFCLPKAAHFTLFFLDLGQE